MQQLDAAAEPATAEPIGIPAAGNGVTPFGLVQLVRRFRAQMELRRRYDAELEAGLERLSRNPRVRRIIKEICEKESSNHG